MKRPKNILKPFFLTILLVAIQGDLLAQSLTDTTDDYMLMVVLVFIIFVAMTLLLVALVVLNALKIMVRQQSRMLAQETGKVWQKEPGFWEKLDKRFLTRAVAVEDEASIILDHDYDGIKELDNHLPPWWKYLFYASIVFAFGYIFAYHVSGVLPLQIQEYNQEMILAEAQKKAVVQEKGGVVIDENNVVFNNDPTIVNSGKQVFITNCAPCHKDLGQGGIGPNLTDEYWLNGGDIKDIFKAVKYGFPDKGMIAWESLLSPQQMSDVASFIKSIAGTNPPDAKAPQGVIYQEQDLNGQEIAVDSAAQIISDSTQIE